MNPPTARQATNKREYKFNRSPESLRGEMNADLRRWARPFVERCLACEADRLKYAKPIRAAKRCYGPATPVLAKGL